MASAAMPRAVSPLGSRARSDPAAVPDRQRAGDSGAAADARAGRPAVGEHHDRGDHAADDDLRAHAAGVQHLSLAAAGHDALPTGAQRGHHAVDSHPGRTPRACWRPAAS